MKNVYQIKNAKKEIDWITADDSESAIDHYRKVHGNITYLAFKKDYTCEKLFPHEMTEKVSFGNVSVPFSELAEMHLTTCIIATNYE